MKALHTLTLVAALLLAAATAHAQCLEIETVLVDACTPGFGSTACTQEGVNEMVRFEVGATDLAVSDISVAWANPSNTFQGWCRDASTAAKTDSLNQTISNTCGFLREPLNDTLPAGATVLAITSADFCISANSFDGLADSIYIIYQCAGNTNGHFANAGSGTRTLSFFVTGPCSQTETVTYDRSLLVGGDGAAVDFTPAGTASYFDSNCNAPVEPLSAGWTLVGGSICIDQGTVNLNTLLTSATPGGVWSGAGVAQDSLFTPPATGSVALTYTVTGGGCTSDSTRTIAIDTVPVTPLAITGCDSVLFEGVWYDSDTSFQNVFGAPTPFGCDSVVDVSIALTGAITGTTTEVDGCDSVLVDGTWYTSDTVLVDTVRGGGTGGGPATCPELFFSEYVEGASNDKALEIYNGTGGTIDLSTYTIEIYFNGNTTPFSTIPLTGFLADGDVHVLTDDGAQPALLALADQTSTETFFNGDDAIRLLNGTTQVDLIGNIGCDPGTEYTGVGDGTQNNILQRQPTWTDGITIDPPNGPPCDWPSFTTANWLSLSSTTDFSGLGSHTALCSGGSGTSACDTLNTTIVTVLQPSVAVRDLVGCDSLQVDGAWFFADTAFRDTLAGDASNGCDSIVQTTLTIGSTIETVLDVQGCDEVVIDGVLYTRDTTVVDVLPGVGGSCDTVRTATITIRSSASSTEAATICAGEVFTLPDGTIVDQTDVYQTTLAAANGCDSVITTDLTVRAPVLDETIIEACDSAVLDAVTVFADTVFTDTLTAGSGCDSIVSTLVTVQATPAVDAGSDTTLFIGESVDLAITDGQDATWSTGDQGPTTTYTATAAGTEPVTVTAFAQDGLCPASDTVLVTVRTADADILVPQAFTPNGDGVNDVFGPTVADGVERMELTIYNRWGQVVFDGEGPAPVWDGTLDGEPQPAGSFLYELEVFLIGQDEANTLAGSVLLLR